MDFQSALSPLPLLGRYYSLLPILITRPIFITTRSNITNLTLPTQARSIFLSFHFMLNLFTSQPLHLRHAPPNKQSMHSMNQCMKSIQHQKNKNKANQLLPPSLHPIHPFHPNANSNLLFRIKQSKAKQAMYTSPNHPIHSVPVQSIPFQSSK